MTSKPRWCVRSHNASLEGQSLRSIARDLNEREVKPARSDAWTLNTIKSLMLRPSITGLRSHKGEIIGEANWEAIIDRKDFEKLTAILTNPLRRPPAPSRSYPLHFPSSTGRTTCFGICHPKAVHIQTQVHRLNHTLGKFVQRKLVRPLGIHRQDSDSPSYCRGLLGGYETRILGS
jgi:hypothetical protein